MQLHANVGSSFAKRHALAALDKAFAQIVVQIRIVETAGLNVFASHVFGLENRV